MRNWKKFKEKIGGDCFNSGLKDYRKIQKYNIPTELLNILKDSNGQKSDCKPIFLEFKNDILGIDNLLYKYLSYDEGLELKEKMKNYTRENNFFPFAKLVNREIDSDGAIVFAINIFDKKIYKMQFYVWDKFVKHIEFKKDVFANNLKEFLENQILCSSFKNW